VLEDTLDLKIHPTKCQFYALVLGIFQLQFLKTKWNLFQ
jgi:hypothetical protein